MLFETLGQARIFLWMTAAGAGLSMLYDLFCLAGSAFWAARRGGFDALFAAGAGALPFGHEAGADERIAAYAAGRRWGWFLYAASVSRFFAGQLKNRELSTKKETDNG